MNLDFIGNTIGDIFGWNKKKKEEPKYRPPVVDNRPYPMRVPGTQPTIKDQIKYAPKPVPSFQDRVNKVNDLFQPGNTALQPTRPKVEIKRQPTVQEQLKTLKPFDDYSQKPNIFTRSKTLDEGIRRNLSLDELSNRTGLSKREIVQFTDVRKPGYQAKDPFTAVRDFLGDTAKSTADIAIKPINTVNLALDKKRSDLLNKTLINFNKDYKAGKISKAKLEDEFNRLTADIIDHGLKVTDKGIEKANFGERLADFGGDFAEAGSNASNVLPAGLSAQAAKNIIAKEGVKALLNKALVLNAKQAIAPGIVNTAVDAARGQEVTPGSLAMNFGLPTVAGVAGDVLGAGMGKLKVANKVADKPGVSIKSFAPLDDITINKVNALKQASDAAPIKPGYKRLFQTNDGVKIKSNQYFGNADELSNYINGRAKNAKLSFIDVPEAAIDVVPGKNGRVLKVNEKQLTLDQIDNNLEDLIFGSRVGGFKTSKAGQLAETLSIGRQTRKLTQPIEGAVNKAIRASEESGSRVIRTPGTVVHSLSRQAGQTPEEIARAAAFQGAKEMGDIQGKTIAQAGEKAVKGGIRSEAVSSLLDPALYKARGGKAIKATAKEIAEADRLRKILDLTHEGQYKIGLLDKNRYLANKGEYMPRDFTEFFSNDANRMISKGNRLELNIFKKRKDLADIPKEVIEAAEKDPYYLVGLKVQQFQKNKAIVQYSDWLSKNGSVINSPRKGYIQVPDNPAYSSLKGKYVLKEQLEDLQGFIYETSAAQNAMALLNLYDRNPIRQTRKSLLTIFNPGVRIGNRTFNYLITSLNGINPITFTKNYSRARKMIKSNSPQYLEAVKQGIFGSNIMDKEMYRSVKLVKDKNIAKKFIDKVADTYQAVDDEAKMAAYITFRERGLDAAEASARTGRILQNYDMVGKFYDIGAKTPVGGNAFVRFSSELLRIAHNTAVDNPVRAIGAMVALSQLVSVASALSGETAEDRKIRESRLGAPRIPFTNQSLEVQTPWGAINAGRLIGLTTYNDLNGNGFDNEAERLMPFTSPITTDADGNIKFNDAFITNSPDVGPLAALALDRDFRGKRISDPENQGQFEELSPEEQNANRLNYLKMAYAPSANDVDNIVSSIRGEENYYGKTRTVPQALLRTAGVKVEQYGSKEAQKSRDIQAYFDEKKYLDDKIATMPKGIAETYKRLTGYYKLREKVPNEFEAGSDRYKKAPVYNFSEDKWKEYVNRPELYDLIKEKKELDNQRQGSPIQPEFDDRLSQEFRNQLIFNKSLAPGEDLEADQRLYGSSEWETYKKLKDEYKEAASKYYPSKDDEFVDEMVKHVANDFPEKPQAKVDYDAAYALYAEGKGPKPVFTDAVAEAKDKYEESKRNWTNDERKARGLPPISKEVWDNVTFGFESDEEKVYKQLKYGKGFGGSSGTRKLPNARVSLKSGGTLKAAPAPSGKRVELKSVAKSRVSKPTIKLKKSKV